MEFLNLIDELYQSLFEPTDSICKLLMIKRCKYFLGLKDEDFLGDYYYQNIKAKEEGVVYTPEAIASYMIKGTVYEEEVLRNPFLRILDPSCGCGHILLPLFKYLKNIYMQNLQTINSTTGLNLNMDNIAEHIVKNNLFGVDIDSTSLKILSIELFLLSGYIEKDNMMRKDFLTEDLEDKFNIVIGNPPYIGTKSIDKVYSGRLRQLYSSVYSDKGDISYCFFMKALRSTRDDFRITFITSRYFMESLSGSELRRYLAASGHIDKVVDFYGNRPFKNAGIDPVIIFLSSEKSDSINVKKPKPELKDFRIIDDECFYTLYIAKNSLGFEPWRLQEKKALEILESIERKSSITLGDVCSSYQGIITGCDKAFIVSRNIIEEYDIEGRILRPWIKSSSIKREGVEVRNELFLIYSNLIEDEEEYPNAIRFIGKFKERLEQRRECRSGKRKWYELQWGREPSIFEGEKIIFPYKCDRNTFALDGGSYFSADVYSLVIKNNIYMDLNYEFLHMVLNSALYEFYFKCFAKKLGGKLFEYYPNNLNRLRIPFQRDFRITAEDELYNYFGLTTMQVDYVKKNRG